MRANFLKENGTIAVIAPSNSVEEDDKIFLENSEKLFNSYGIKIVYGKNIFSNCLGYGASVEEKIEDLHWSFKNKNVDGIIFAKGGENSNSLFEYIDYELIKNNPKIVCGYSDSTYLLNMIYEKTGLITFHGSTFKSLTSWKTTYGFEEIIARFINKSKDLKREDEKFETIFEGKGEGILIGGNLNCISNMVCGKYSLNFKDKILFIEDLGRESNPKFISSFLYFMKQNDIFSKINGIWIGEYEHESGITLEKILLDVIGTKNIFKIPIIKSKNFGHIEKRQVIPIGVKVSINTFDENKIRILDDFLE